MKFLTLELIKAQLRIEPDFHDEDILLKLYGRSAETTIFNTIRRTFEDVFNEYGEMPSDLVHAALLLVDISYQYRSPVSTQNMAMVPNSFEMIVKPYMKLTY